MKCKYLPIIFLTSSLLLNACREDEPIVVDQKKIDEELLQDYFTQHQISPIHDPDGFYYEILQENASGQVIGDHEIALVYYKISLLSGKVIEVRVAENSQPLRFLHSWGGLIPEGINYGIGLMKKGEKFKFYLPSDMAFGNFYAKGIMGRNEILIAEIELVDIETRAEQTQWEDDSIKSYLVSHQITNFETLSSGIYKYKINSGYGAMPQAGNLVKVAMKRKYLNGKPTHSLNIGDTVDIYIPQGSDDYYPNVSRATEGLKTGLLNMQLGEQAVVLVPSHLAFGGSLVEVLDNNNKVVGYNGSIQVFPQKFRDDYVEHHLEMQNIYPLTILQYELRLLQIY